MKSCNFLQGVLLLLVLACVSGPSLALDHVIGKLHHAVKLPCKQCRGVLQWSMFSKPGYILAECNKTSCHSEEGFKISRDEYLSGDPSLTILSVDYSMMTIYQCYCDQTIISDVRLSIEPLTSSFLMKPGEDLLMNVPIFLPTEVTFKDKNSSALYGEPICIVVNSLLQCKEEYRSRVLFNHQNLKLGGVKESDSGIYTVREIKYNEVIHSYTITVKVEEQKPEDGDARLMWIVPLVLVLLVLMLVVVIGVIFMNHKQKKNIQQLEKEKLYLKNTVQIYEAEQQQSRPRSHSDTDSVQFIKRVNDVEKLIEQYGDRALSGSQSWTGSSDITVVEKLSKKKEEMNTIVEQWNSNRSDVVDLSEWWSRKSSELDRIIEQRRMKPTELDELKLKIKDLNNGNISPFSHSNVPILRSTSLKNTDRRRSRSCSDSLRTYSSTNEKPESFQLKVNLQTEGGSATVTEKLLSDLPEEEE